MSVDTRVFGDPVAVRGAGTWLRDRFAGAVTHTVDEVQGARRDSEAAWSGAAAEAFRGRTRSASGGADLLADDAIGVARSLDRYAADLDTALAGMARARQIAADGGLDVVDEVVADPGPGIALAALPAGSTPEQSQAHTAAIERAQVQERRIAAYMAAGEQAEWARRQLRGAAEIGRRYWGEVTGKWHLNSAAFVNGVLGEAAKYNRSVLLGEANSLTAEADRLRAHYLQSAGGSAQARALTQAEYAARNGADDALRRAGGPWTTVGRVAKFANPAIVAAGIGYDISQGKPPGKAVTSGVAAGVVGWGVTSAGTGILIGLGVSNPIGWAALAGVGVAIAAGLGADWAYDQLPPDVGSAIDDGLTTVARGIADGATDTWEAVFG